MDFLVPCCFKVGENAIETTEKKSILQISSQRWKHQPHSDVLANCVLRKYVGLSHLLFKKQQLAECKKIGRSRTPSNLLESDHQNVHSGFAGCCPRARLPPADGPSGPPSFFGGGETCRSLFGGKNCFQYLFLQSPEKIAWLFPQRIGGIKKNRFLSFRVRKRAFLRVASVEVAKKKNRDSADSGQKI